MSKKFILGTLILTLFASCSEKTNNEKTELTSIVNQLKIDKNNEFLKTLKPSEVDFKLIFQDGKSVNKAISYSEMKWSDISKIPENSMKPLTEDAKLKILSVTKNDLLSGKTNGFPKEYLTLTDHIKNKR